MNLRKAWRVAKSTRPHAVVFLGDMMDNGFADMHITQYVLCAHVLTHSIPLPSLSDSSIQVPSLSLPTLYFGS